MKLWHRKLSAILLPHRGFCHFERTRILVVSGFTFKVGRAQAALRPRCEHENMAEVANASDSVDVICVDNNFADATGNSMTDANESAVKSESTFYQ